MGLLTRSAMRHLGLTACLAAITLAGHAATDIEAAIDLRVIATDSERSELDGGLGRTRFGDDARSVQLGRARLGLQQHLGEIAKLHIDASAWGTADGTSVDVTELYLELRPYPQGPWRYQLRAGAFYPPGSLAVRASGWETPYTLSASAADTWIAEEIRTIGVEAQAQWLGGANTHYQRASVAAGIFGWNDPAGVLLAQHGLAWHDRQTGLFERTGAGDSPYLAARELFHEIDGRAGFYVALDWQLPERAELLGLHYDNRADPSQYSAALMDFAWLTKFDTVAIRAELGTHWTLLGQWLGGYTLIEVPAELEWYFDTASLLASYERGGQRFSVRYDESSVDANAAAGGSADRGHAFTFAYSRDFGTTWNLRAEWLRTDSRIALRPLALGEPAKRDESLLQLSLRYRWSTQR
ncbi:MAG: hypothetical protein R3E77_10645 [Steroidobacteraceae bacterium]